MSRDLNKSFRIHIQAGQGNLPELIDDLARQVVKKNVDEFQANNYRVKKIAALGRAI
ncbi:hypothetical protein [Cohnella terricola]|uniref:hypothetical protein n=1 Tax=Cohnella terricola TaxID=1289167 RepID=UPI0016446423|nr:hypothetical protein [Cohnella terricola]